jgi:hypothetical protein
MHDVFTRYPAEVLCMLNPHPGCQRSGARPRGNVTASLSISRLKAATSCSNESSNRD